MSLNITLVDMDDDISLSSLRISDEESLAEERKEEKSEDPPEENPVPEEKTESEEKTEPEEKTDPEIKSSHESVCSTPETKYTWQPDSEADARTITSSVYSCMRPLPSDVAADLKKGFYKDAAEYGSSIFENWTEGGDRSEDLGRRTEISEEWEVEVEEEESEAEEETEEEKSVPPMSERPIEHHRKPLPEKKIAPPPVMNELVIDRRRKKVSPEKKKTGLMKCLSNIYAFELTFVCGSNQFKLKKRLRNFDRGHHRSHSDGALGGKAHHRGHSEGKLGKFYG